MLIVLPLFALFVCLPQKGESQEIQFSQFYAAPLYLSPSFAGSSNGSRLAMSYRNQWPQMPGTFVAYSVSFDHYFKDYNSGVGFLFYSDQAGSGNLSTTSSSFLYSYNFKINSSWTIRPGVQFLYEQRNLDFHRLIFEDQLSIDGSVSPSTQATNPTERTSYFDAASSVMVYSDEIWGGLSLDHLMMPNQSLIGSQVDVIPLRLNVFGGYRYNYGSMLEGKPDESLSFNFMFKKQGRFNQLDIGAYWSKTPIFAGLLYRGLPFFNHQMQGIFNSEALVFMGGLRTRFLRIGYSYDYTISRLINNTGGAHEISIIYEFNQRSGTE